MFEANDTRPSDSIGNLAEAVKLLCDAAYRDGFWILSEAQHEAKSLVAVIARLRTEAYPEPFEEAP